MKNKLLSEHDGLPDAMMKERLFSKDYMLIVIAATCTSFMNILYGSSTALHVIAIGGHQVQAGLLVTVNAIGALVIRPVSGIMSDRIGRVKLLILGAMMSAVFSFLYGLAGGIMMLLFLRSIIGIGFGIHSTCAGAVAADVLPKSRLAEGIGIYGLGGTLAQAIAPIIAIAIIGDGSPDNFRILFFFIAGLCAFGALSDCNITYERKRRKAALLTAPANGGGDKDKTVKPAEPETETGAPQKTFFGFEYVVFAPMAVMVLHFIATAALLSFFVPFARELGIENPGYYYMISAFGMLISRLIFGRISDRHGNDVVLIPGFITFIICLALMPFGKSLLYFLILALPIGLSQGALTPTFHSLIFKRSSPVRRGGASGAAWSANDLGLAIGSPLLGAIADASNYRYLFWAASVFAVLAFSCYVLTASDRIFNKKKGNVNS